MASRRTDDKIMGGYGRTSKDEEDTGVTGEAMKTGRYRTWTSGEVSRGKGLTATPSSTDERQGWKRTEYTKGRLEKVLLETHGRVLGGPSFVYTYRLSFFCVFSDNPLTTIDRTSDVLDGLDLSRERLGVKVSVSG